jgi:hypothetical protein
MNETIRPIDEVDSDEAAVEFMEQIRERAKHLSRSCVEVHHPHVAAKALWMLAQGAKIRDIAAITSLGHASIRALEWRHNDTLETKRKEFSQKYAIAAQTFTDLLFDKAEQLADNPEQLVSISPDKLALTVGIMTDKAAQLSGMAGVVIEHRKGDRNPCWLGLSRYRRFVSRRNLAST